MRQNPIEQLKNYETKRSVTSNVKLSGVFDMLRLQNQDRYH